MLKLATVSDYDDLIRLAHAFFDASPYKPFGIDDKRVTELIDWFLTSRPEDRILILWVVDDKPVGVLAAAADRNLFNNERMACEIMWWIDPEHRRSKAAGKMIEAYEFWARKIGCQFCTLVDLLGNLDTYYKRKGYERRETSYIKVL